MLAATATRRGPANCWGGKPSVAWRPCAPTRGTGNPTTATATSQLLLQVQLLPRIRKREEKGVERGFGGVSFGANAIEKADEEVYLASGINKPKYRYIQEPVIWIREPAPFRTGLLCLLPRIGPEGSMELYMNLALRKTALSPVRLALV